MNEKASTLDFLEKVTNVTSLSIKETVYWLLISAITVRMVITALVSFEIIRGMSDFSLDYILILRYSAHLGTMK